jgi:MFS family permease
VDKYTVAKTYTEGYPQFLSYFNFDATKIGALGSVYYAGNFAGSLCNVYFPDRFGRLRTIQGACVVSVLGAAMQTGAQNLGVLLAGRFMGGLAAGVIYAVCPLYASEIAPPAVRGRVGGLYA